MLRRQPWIVLGLQAPNAPKRLRGLSLVVNEAQRQLISSDWWNAQH